jgi:hypothetical protein
MNVLYIIHIKSNIHLMFWTGFFHNFLVPSSSNRCEVHGDVGPGKPFDGSLPLGSCRDAEMLFWVEMEVSRFRGFRFVMGDPQFSSISRDFPWNKPSSYWEYPHLWQSPCDGLNLTHGFCGFENGGDMEQFQQFMATCVGKTGFSSIKFWAILFSDKSTGWW